MGDKLRILIVDDDEGMAETISDILEDLDFHVDVVNNGYDAIDIMNNSEYNLILMDIQMPGINGVETFKEIKKNKPDVKVIIMTAYTVEELIQEAINEGAYKVFSKPLDLNVLIKNIERSEDGNLIMIVDDNENSVETLEDILKEKGFNVKKATKAEDALKIVEKSKVEIIFIDIMMPVINGVELYKKIKEKNPNVIAVMMTGYRNEASDLIQEAINRDAYTCLFKPFNPQKIVDLVSFLKKNDMK
jgi:two-component system response regulator HydG